jgi:sodium/potassium-transporting ATPase subunit alpha
MYDLDETRGANPVHTYQKGGKTIECKIPFSSDIKFNLFIRDTNPAVRNPTNVDDNLCVFMKGAPERILSRCTKMLIGGEEVEFTDELRNDVNKANSDFGKLGERVLAFARFRLSPEKYPKSSYEFDVRTWKNWGLDVNQKFEDYERVEGSFPMHDLCLMGVVSLNDPPRPMVDLSVNKCRSAGIKVIMVTGDQPPTAAAIAHKVNILKHPELEFNYLVKEMGMTE